MPGKNGTARKAPKKKKPGAKRGRGRPTKFTPEVADKIISFIRAGNYVQIAAEAAGIHRETFYDWFKKGNRNFSPELSDFSDRVKKAVCESESHSVMTIKAASEKQWQAAAWYLERKHSERWGRKDRHELTGKDGGPIESKTRVTLTIDGVLDEYNESFGRLQTGMCEAAQDDRPREQIHPS